MHLFSLQLKSIQNMIRLTKENLEALNERFADSQQPPLFYLNEHEELTSKLKDFQKQERQILAEMAATKPGSGLDTSLDNEAIQTSISHNFVSDIDFYWSWQQISWINIS